VADVQVALVGPPAAGAQVVAAFDAFHVMYASAAAAAGEPAARAADPAFAERLLRVVELARVSVFNEQVRSFLPVVREQLRE
jgi:hypothetical protein